MPESSFLLYIINKRNVSRLCRMNKLQEATYFPPHFLAENSRSELRKVMLEWAKQF